MVVPPSKALLWGVEQSKEEKTLLDVRKFCKGLASGLLQSVVLLFHPTPVFQSRWWKLLVAHREAFVTRKVVGSAAASVRYGLGSGSHANKCKNKNQEKLRLTCQSHLALLRQVLPNNHQEDVDPSSLPFPEHPSEPTLLLLDQLLQRLLLGSLVDDSTKK